jgi:hypothetical protein
MLELSTEHLTPDDADILQELAGYGAGHPPAKHPLSVHPHATGWIVCMKPRDAGSRAEAMDLGLSPHFIGVLQHAEALDAESIRFAREAAYEPGLPTFTRAHILARKTIEPRSDNEPCIPKP